MTASRAARAHVGQVELGIEAQVLARQEERLLCRACADLKRACELHRELDGLVRELTGRVERDAAAVRA